MRFKFGLRSKGNLVFVHPDLVAVATKALELSPVDFAITEGVRSKARQLDLVAAGLSQAVNSRHLTGHAVDVAAYFNGRVTWEWTCYSDIAIAFKEASKELGIPIEWGGDWKHFKDGPHFQLPWKSYPVLENTVGDNT